MGAWGEPSAISTCTSLLTMSTASGELQKLGSIFKISEIELQKGRGGTPA